eukprot:gene236-107_t
MGKEARTKKHTINKSDRRPALLLDTDAALHTRFGLDVDDDLALAWLAANNGDSDDAAYFEASSSVGSGGDDTSRQDPRYGVNPQLSHLAGVVDKMLTQVQMGDDLRNFELVACTATHGNTPSVGHTCANLRHAVETLFAARRDRASRRGPPPVACGSGWFSDFRAVDPKTGFTPNEAAGLLADTTRRMRDEEGRSVVWVAVGALTNVAAAIYHFPGALPDRLIVMGGALGDVAEGGGGSGGLLGQIELNFFADRAATEYVLGRDSPLRRVMVADTAELTGGFTVPKIVVTPLETCFAGLVTRPVLDRLAIRVEQREVENQRENERKLSEASEAAMANAQDGGSESMMMLSAGRLILGAGAPTEPWLKALWPTLERHAWLWGRWCNWALFGRHSAYVKRLVESPHAQSGSFFPWDTVTAAFATEGWSLFAGRACVDWDADTRGLATLSVVSDRPPAKDLLAETTTQCDEILTALVKRRHEPHGDGPRRLTDSAGAPIWPLLVPLGLKTGVFHDRFIDRLSAVRRHAPARLPGFPLGSHAALGLAWCFLLWALAVTVRVYRARRAGVAILPSLGAVFRLCRRSPAPTPEAAATTPKAASATTPEDTKKTKLEKHTVRAEIKEGKRQRGQPLVRPVRWQCATGGAEEGDIPVAAAAIQLLHVCKEGHSPMREKQLVGGWTLGRRFVL